MERHIRILALLSRLWGALAVLVGLSMLTLAAGALALLAAPEGTTVGFAAGVTAGIFAMTSFFALVWGSASLWSGILIGRHESRGRMFGLALGVVNLLVVPFGTALGAYALWVLLSRDGRHIFEAPTVN